MLLWQSRTVILPRGEPAWYHCSDVPLTSLSRFPGIEEAAGSARSNAQDDDDDDDEVVVDFAEKL